ncbi:hypothetical protein AB3M99_15805 [Paenibacillus taichungensis]
MIILYGARPGVRGSVLTRDMKGDELLRLYILMDGTSRHIMFNNGYNGKGLPENDAGGLMDSVE